MVRHELYLIYSLRLCYPWCTAIRAIGRLIAIGLMGHPFVSTYPMKALSASNTAIGQSLSLRAQWFIADGAFFIGLHRPLLHILVDVGVSLDRGMTGQEAFH